MDEIVWAKSILIVRLAPSTKMMTTANRQISSAASGAGGVGERERRLGGGGSGGEAGVAEQGKSRADW